MPPLKSQEQLSLLSQKLDQVIEVVGEIRQDVKGIGTRTGVVERRQDVMDAEVKYIKDDVKECMDENKNWRKALIGSVSGALSGIVTATIAWLTTK